MLVSGNPLFGVSPGNRQPYSGNDTSPLVSTMVPSLVTGPLTAPFGPNE